MWRWWYWPISVHDAAGRRVPLIGADAHAWSKAEWDAVARWRTAHISWRMLPRLRIAALAVAFFMMILLFGAMPAVLTFGLHHWIPGSLWLWLLPMGLVLGATQGWFFTNLTRWVAAQAMVGAYTSIGRCASCGYPASREPTTADDEVSTRTICSECGSMWQVPVIGHSTFSSNGTAGKPSAL